MKIIHKDRYNQGIGKNKLLSSTSGVGAIITTKVGSYILISDINHWGFIDQLNRKVASLRTEHIDGPTFYSLTKNEIEYRGLHCIDDERFIKFLRKEKKLHQLAGLVEIPHMSLNESFNTPNWRDNPIRKKLEQNGIKGIAYDHMVKGTHFPKWFRDKDGNLKTIDQWFAIWLDKCKTDKTIKPENFSPPRDAGHKHIDEIKSTDGPLNIYRLLDQTHLILICPNGHLSNIPWPNYLRWRTEKLTLKDKKEDKGEELLSPDKIGPCCSAPQLKWTESKTKSEGYASVYIECENCKMGTGDVKEHPKVNLEGINSLQPYCRGEKPWEIDPIRGSDTIPAELCYKMGDSSKGREQMRVTLVTGNNVYYANIFTSLYIPPTQEGKELASALERLTQKYHSYIEYIKEEGFPAVTYFDEVINFEELLIDRNIKPEDPALFKKKLRTLFIDEATEETFIDTYNSYRWEEYNCFKEHIEMGGDIGLKFNEIDLPAELKPYFTKIQQVEELKVTNVQLDFTRVQPTQRIVEKGIVKESSSGQSIYSIPPEELYILPATEAKGEGLFFQFSDDAIHTWIVENKKELMDRSRKFMEYERKEGKNEQGVSLKMRLKENHFKHFLIHTFSHLLMRELEFSCGYPTVSLKERLYISNTEQNMSGVLIYTAEGAEGSMGGLVSQGEPEKIKKILEKALKRAFTCSADPLCWESEGQGILDLNLAACFSCSLVSETACEEMNLGLDRRVLVDEEYGFFKDLI